jgi:hypothetical protein
MPVKMKENWFVHRERNDHEWKSECPEKYFSFVIKMYFPFLNENQFWREFSSRVSYTLWY